MKKFPPIPIRDGGGRFTINNPDDGTPIKEMFTLGDGLLMITEKCTYRLQVADQIDPKRENPKLPPNFQQKLFEYGTNSELVCRTLLQAKVMFRKEFQTVDIDQAMQLSLNALGDLVSMHESAQAFNKSYQTAIENADRLPTIDHSLTLPSIGNVRVHCKTFIQKADHFTSALLGLVRLFYPDMAGKKWTFFLEKVRNSHGEADHFRQVVEFTVPLLKLARDTRNCLEHVNHAGVKTSDFTLQADGTVEVPSIEIDYDGSAHDRCPITWFMEETKNALVTAFEMLIVHMCSQSMKDFAGMSMSIGTLPENYQKAWHVRFSYGAYYRGGQFVPCG